MLHRDLPTLVRWHPPTCKTTPVSRLATNREPSGAGLGATAREAGPAGSGTAKRCHRSARQAHRDDGRVEGKHDRREQAQKSAGGGAKAALESGRAHPRQGLRPHTRTCRVKRLHQPRLCRPRCECHSVGRAHSQRRGRRGPGQAARPALAACRAFAAAAACAGAAFCGPAVAPIQHRAAVPAEQHLCSEEAARKRVAASWQKRRTAPAAAPSLALSPLPSNYQGATPEGDTAAMQGAGPFVVNSWDSAPVATSIAT